MNESIEVIESKVCKTIESLPRTDAVLLFKKTFEQIRFALKEYKPSNNVVWTSK